MLEGFPLDKVRLEDREFAARRALTKRYVADFDLDRLLHTFRRNAGLPSAAEPLGGWESEDCGLRGHFVGHYLSAIARFAFGDRDAALARKADELVARLAECARPDGYLSAFEESTFDTLEKEEDRGVWAPYYTLHKLLQGLVDCRRLLGSAQALQLATGLARYVDGRFARLSHWKVEGILRCTRVNPMNEFGGIGDALYDLYELVGERWILDLAERFDRDYFLGPLERGEDLLEDLHANTHLPMVQAAMHRYDLTGEARFREAAFRFYDALLGRTFANGNSSSKATHFIPGGVSEHSEHWGACGDLHDALTGKESESCCAHNTVRILRRFIRWTGDVRFLEHLEILKWNAVLNAASARTGLSQYEQKMGSGVAKRFSGPFDSFWCCTGSGMEAQAELQSDLWFRSGESILANQFVSSTVEWDEMGATIRQVSEYPDVLVSRLEFRMARPARIRLLLRAAAVQSLQVGTDPTDAVEENGFLVLDRVFRDGDVVRIGIASPLSLVPLLGAPGVAALRSGPLLLAQVRGTAPASGDDAGRFVPLYRVEDEAYTVYQAMDEVPPANLVAVGRSASR